MKNKKLIGILLTAIVAAIGVVIFQGQINTARDSDNKTQEIRIGAKDFTENLLVAEIYALALEDKGYKVKRVYNIASSIIHNAILSDEIDLYPEYTGTGLLAILKEKLETNPDKVYEIVKREYLSRFDLVWLNYTAASDSQGLVVRTPVAEALGIKNISDLQRNAPRLRFASQGEFDQREDGILGLEKVYGKFDWQSSKIYDNSLKYSILENNEADVTPAYTTEGQLVNADKFTLLIDDRMFWPPYNLAPVIKNSVLKVNPEIEQILNNISRYIDTATITELNARVDVTGEEYRAVAKDFYEKVFKGHRSL